ncbi:thioesterase II family protein [Streptomyces sp. GS7]|uniref:thioesterase II family protein n=1 Tax=Streptomyces sp. GS7 TaxID=2692234 RepID=UPI001315DC04|nr:alpha/beta fold hydrolase [Streptomyces sp. GS7]QHC22573.1 alpha/beta fold hydrolase [Streptomyces sp. GS7]
MTTAFTPDSDAAAPGPPVTPADAVVRPRPVPDPALRVFLLHHAAGSHLAYTDWVAHFPDDWEVCLFEAPGRGRVAPLPPLRTAADLAGFFIEATTGLLDTPFVLFGHSMGALVAYETAAQLGTRGLPQPRWLGVSACEAPYDAIPGEGAGGEALHRMPAGRLRAALRALGGMPETVLADDDVWALFEARVRADFSVVETWEPRTAASEIRPPLSLFGGRDDPVVHRDDLLEWADGAEVHLGQHFFPGGHFYFEGQSALVVGQLVRDIRTAMTDVA